MGDVPGPFRRVLVGAPRAKPSLGAGGGWGSPRLRSSCPAAENLRAEGKNGPKAGFSKDSFQNPEAQAGAALQAGRRHREGKRLRVGAGPGDFVDFGKHEGLSCRPHRATGLGSRRSRGGFLGWLKGDKAIPKVFHLQLRGGTRGPAPAPFSSQTGPLGTRSSSTSASSQTIFWFKPGLKPLEEELSPSRAAGP